MPAARCVVSTVRQSLEPSANVETDPAWPPAPRKEAAWSCAPATSAVLTGTPSRSAASPETVPIGVPQGTTSENGTTGNQKASTSAADNMSADEDADATSKRRVYAD